MKKFLFVLAMLLPQISNAEVHIAEWGVAETFNFKLYNADGTLDVDEVDGGTEVSIACDEGAETTATNDFVDEGNFYSIALTGAELQCARATVVVAATLTEAFFVETVGHPDAQVPCPAGDCVTTGTMQASTASTAVFAAATNFPNDYLNGVLVKIVAGTGIGQTRVCSDWVQSTDTCTVHLTWDTTPDTSSKYLVEFDSRAIIEVNASGQASALVKAMDPDVIDATVIAVNTIGSSELAADAIGADELATDAIGADEIGVGAIGSTEIAASAIGASELGNDAVDEIWDEVVETAGATYTGRCLLAMLGAYAAGEFSTSGNTTTYQDTGGNSTRIIGTTTVNGRDTMSITCP